MNSFRELCEQRYSARAFLPTKIEQGKIDYILRCAQLAPSAANLQSCFFYVVTNDEVQKEIHKTYDRDWFAKAPLYIVVCADSSQSWKRSNSDGKDHADIDATIAASNIYLAAHELGLGICWVCNFDPSALKKVLKAEENIEPIVIFPIGYIDKKENKVPTKKRKELSEIVKLI